VEAWGDEKYLVWTRQLEVGKESGGGGSGEQDTAEPTLKRAGKEGEALGLRFEEGALHPPPLSLPMEFKRGGIRGLAV